MKILFCGTQVPEKIEYRVKDISAAGNRFQNNLTANLRACGHEVRECVYIGVPVEQQVRESLSGETIVFKRDGFLKSILTYRRRVRKLLGDSDAVICYNITYAWIFLPFWAGRKQVRSIAVIADYSGVESYASLPGKLYARLQKFSMRRFDTVVGLSRNIRTKLREKQSFVLMEGGIDRKLFDRFSYAEREEKKPVTMLYAGLLSPVTGVDRLLELLEKVENQEIRLLISGKGELEEMVRRSAEKDARIQYLGYLTYEEYLQQLNEADVLLNPRNMELPENQNNFPSKIMDYLAAGKAIISTKFVGWEKFSQHIIFCDSYEEMAVQMNAFTVVQDKERFDANRKFAQKFLWEEQIERMLE